MNPWRTTRDWKASRPKFAAAVLIVVLLAALYAMFNLDIFFVTDPRVVRQQNCAERRNSKSIGRARLEYLFCRAARGREAVKALPEFQDVQTYVTLPNTVTIYTTERKPRFVWEVAGKKYWVDDEGIAMRPRGMVPSGWHVRDAEGKAIKYGERVNPDAFNAAVSLINVWKNAPKYFEWTKAHGLTLRDDHGWLVYLAAPAKWTTKSQPSTSSPANWKKTNER